MMIVKFKIPRNTLNSNHTSVIIPLNDNSFTSKVINDHRFADFDSSNQVRLPDGVLGELSRVVPRPPDASLNDDVH